MEAGSFRYKDESLIKVIENLDAMQLQWYSKKFLDEDRHPERA